MFKKGVSRSLVFIFVFWLLTTVFFYSQHQRFIWGTEIPGSEDLKHQGVQIKEVYFYDWEKRQLRFEEMKEINEYINAIAQKLPKEWRLKFIYTVSR